MFNFFKHRKNNETEDIVKQQQIAEQPTVPKTRNQIDKQFNKTVNNSVGKTHRKSANGLKPIEILMLSMAQNYTNGKNEFPRYWNTMYNVHNPQEILDMLKERGFIELGVLRDALMNDKVVNLKALLSKYGISAKGKKNELVDVLMNNVDNTILNTQYPYRHYQYTELGIEELRQNEYVSYLHNNQIYGIGISEMNTLLSMNNFDNSQYKEVMMHVFEKQAETHYNNNNFGLYRNAYMKMYMLTMELDDDGKYRQAFEYLAEMLFYDLSGIGNDNFQYHESNKGFFYELLEMSIYPYIRDNGGRCSISLAPSSVDGWLPDMKVKMHAGTDNEFRHILIEKFKEINKKCPFHVFTIEESADICIWEMNKETDKLIDLYEKKKNCIESKIEKYGRYCTRGPSDSN